MQRLVKKWGSKPGSIFEAIALVSITLLLIGFYLYSSDSVTALWLVGWGALAAISIVGSIVASYYQVQENNNRDETTEYRISYQLIETLKTKEALPDVTFGLQRLILFQGERTFDGQTSFLKELEKTFGSVRLKEVEATLLKYARGPRSTKSLKTTVAEAAGGLPSDNGGPAATDSVVKPTDNGSPKPAATLSAGR